MNRTHINRNLVGKPFLIQFAKDYEFEDGYKIRTPFDFDLQKFETYLDDSHETLCVEIFVKDKTDRTVVFGFTYDKDMKLKGEMDFVENCLQFVQEYKDFNDFIQKIETIFLGKKGIMYKGGPDLLRIGILDYWFSTGPALIWKYGDTQKITRDHIKEIMKDWPDIVETELNTQGISWLFGKKRYGVSHWIMWQCGEKQENRYFLDYKRVMELVSGG